MISGYIFWLVMSLITTAETIGVASTVISIGTIFASISTLGVPLAVQRFLGKNIADEKYGDATVFVRLSLLIVSAGIFGCGIAMMALQPFLSLNLGLSFGLIAVSILLVSASAIVTLFRSIIIATLKTKMLAIVMTIASSAKFLLTTILILAGSGTIGLVIGFTSQHILSSIILGIIILFIFRASKASEMYTITGTLKKLLSAGLANWIPTLILAISSNLGTIVVFGAHGAFEAGTYFMAFAIFNAITGIMYSLFSVTYPVLSGMSDGRKRLTSKIIKLGVFVSLPLGSSFVFYSGDVLQLLGRDYSDASLSLSLLLISLLPIAVSSGISNLSYAYGNYKQVLMIGLATNIPRTILYFPLVAIYEGTGAAEAWTIGSIIGFIVSLIIAKRNKILLPWKAILLTSLLPVALSFAFSFAKVNFIVGIVGTVIITYLALVRFDVVSANDFQDSLGVLPRSITAPIMSVLLLLRKLKLAR